MIDVHNESVRFHAAESLILGPLALGQLGEAKPSVLVGRVTQVDVFVRA